MELWKTIIGWKGRTFESIIFAESYESAIELTLFGLKGEWFLNCSDYKSTKYIDSIRIKTDFTEIRDVLLE